MGFRKKKTNRQVRTESNFRMKKVWKCKSSPPSETRVYFCMFFMWNRAETCSHTSPTIWASICHFYLSKAHRKAPKTLKKVVRGQIATVQIPCQYFFLCIKLIRHNLYTRFWFLFFIVCLGVIQVLILNTKSTQNHGKILECFSW